MIEVKRVHDDHPDLKTGAAGRSIPVRMGRTRRIVMRVVGDECVASTRYRVLTHRDALEEAGFATEAQFLKALRRKFGRLPLRFMDLVANT